MEYLCWQRVPSSSGELVQEMALSRLREEQGAHGPKGGCPLLVWSWTCPGEICCSTGALSGAAGPGLGEPCTPAVQRKFDFTEHIPYSCPASIAQEMSGSYRGPQSSDNQRDAVEVR